MKKDNDLRDRLFKVTSQLKKLQQEKSIPDSEQWTYEPHSHDNREHPRQDVPVYGIFETENSQFRALTKNVSMGGVLVDFETQLSFHEHIDMTFIHRDFNAPVRTNGRVVRVDSDGVGIQFNKVVPVMASL
jgi:hypothetical protein